MIINGSHRRLFSEFLFALTFKTIQLFGVSHEICELAAPTSISRDSWQFYQRELSAVSHRIAPVILIK